MSTWLTDEWFNDPEVPIEEKQQAIALFGGFNSWAEFQEYVNRDPWWMKAGASKEA